MTLAVSSMVPLSTIVLKATAQLGGLKIRHKLQVLRLVSGAKMELLLLVFRLLPPTLDLLLVLQIRFFFLDTTMIIP